MQITLTAFEFDVLKRMDTAFCAAMTGELAYAQNAAREQAERKK